MNVAVIIPALNAAPWLPKVLERTKHVVPEQSIFVIDDGSNDSTSEIAKNYAVNIMTHRVNKGRDMNHHIFKFN